LAVGLNLGRFAGLWSMPYKQFVEVGRATLSVFGPLVDELAIIVDLVDDKRVLIDLIDVPDARQVISVKRLKLTDFKAQIERGASPADVTAAVAAADIAKTFAETKWGKKLAAAKARSQLNDFQRFKYSNLVAERAKFLTAPEKGGKGKQGAQGKQQVVQAKPAKGGKK
jgi:large subunit ribosomal protein L14e